MNRVLPVGGPALIPIQYRHRCAWLHTPRLLSEHVGIAAHDAGERSPCTLCHALLWQEEKNRTSICCCAGKVRLPSQLPLNEAAQAILSMWSNQGDEGKLLRQFARPINNALALAAAKIAQVSVFFFLQKTEVCMCTFTHTHTYTI